MIFSFSSIILRISSSRAFNSFEFSRLVSRSLVIKCSKRLTCPYIFSYLASICESLEAKFCICAESFSSKRTTLDSLIFTRVSNDATLSADRRANSLICVRCSSKCRFILNISSHISVRFFSSSCAYFLSRSSLALNSAINLAGSNKFCFPLFTIFCCCCCACCCCCNANCSCALVLALLRPFLPPGNIPPPGSCADDPIPTFCRLLLLLPLPTLTYPFNDVPLPAPAILYCKISVSTCRNLSFASRISSASCIRNFSKYAVRSRKVFSFLSANEDIRSSWSFNFFLSALSSTSIFWTKLKLCICSIATSISSYLLLLKSCDGSILFWLSSYEKDLLIIFRLRLLFLLLRFCFSYLLRFSSSDEYRRLIDCTGLFKIRRSGDPIFSIGTCPGLSVTEDGRLFTCGITREVGAFICRRIPAGTSNGILLFLFDFVFGCECLICSPSFSSFFVSKLLRIAKNAAFDELTCLTRLCGTSCTPIFKPSSSFPVIFFCIFFRRNSSTWCFKSSAYSFFISAFILSLRYPSLPHKGVLLFARSKRVKSFSNWLRFNPGFCPTYAIGK